MTISIEKNIPLPTRTCRVVFKYPWVEMQAGDSFVIPDGVDIDNFRSQASVQGRLRGLKFSVRAVNGSRYRCWRIA